MLALKSCVTDLKRFLRIDARMATAFASDDQVIDVRTAEVVEQIEATHTPGPPTNDDERPFSRNQRRWIYASAKHQNPSFSFGTDAEFERTPGYIIISPVAFPAPPPPEGDPDNWPIPSAKVLGEARGRVHAFRPASIVNISGMSFG